MGTVDLSPELGGPGGVAAVALLAAGASIVAFPDPDPRMRRNARFIAGLCALALVGELGLLQERDRGRHALVGPHEVRRDEAAFAADCPRERLDGRAPRG